MVTALYAMQRSHLKISSRRQSLLKQQEVRKIRRRLVRVLLHKKYRKTIYEKTSLTQYYVRLFLDSYYSGY